MLIKWVAGAISLAGDGSPASPFAKVTSEFKPVTQWPTENGSLGIATPFGAVFMSVNGLLPEDTYTHKPPNPCAVCNSRVT